MLKALIKSDYLLRETLLGLRRGGWMNWAAVSTVTVLLFLFGLSLQASWQMEGLLTQFGNQLEVSVYLETGIQAADLQPIVEAVPHVRSVQPVSKEAAWAALVQEMGLSNVQGATQQLNGNPLVDELKVKVDRSEVVEPVVQAIEQIAGVDEVQYVNEVVKRVGQLDRGLQSLSLGMTTMLSLASLAVVTTTIRLIVMARRREIEVMQLVGATQSWIYLPFILQGLLLGCVGALVAWGLVAAVQQFIRNLLSQQPEFIQFLSNGMTLSTAQVLLLPIALLGLGSSIGLLGSLLAVRRVALK